MPLSEICLLVHVVSTLFMFGLIWVVQLVHYPLMRYVELRDFPAFEQAHQRRITFLVGPGMLLELISGVALLAFVPPGVSAIWIWIGAGLIGVNLVSTATLQAPYHHQLSRGFDPRIWRLLVQTNWIRTVAWSLRAAVVMTMLIQLLANRSV